MKEFICNLIALIACACMLCACGGKEDVTGSGTGDETETEEKMTGAFYTLQEAFDSAILTHEDLEELGNACLNHTYSVRDVRADLSEKIIKDYAIFESESSDIKFNADDFYVWNYFGEYHGAYVIQISKNDAVYPDFSREEVIDGISIRCGGGPEMLVWKQ